MNRSGISLIEISENNHDENRRGTAIVTVDLILFSPSHRVMEDMESSLAIEGRSELTMLNKHHCILIVLIEPFDISLIVLGVIGQLL